MELKEAKLILNYQLTTVKGTNVYSPIDYEAVETILQELDNLQKDNKELMNEYHKRVQERINIEQELKDSISKDRIKAKIDEIQSTIQVYGGFTAGKMVEYYRKLGKIEALKNLLNEEI